MPNTAHKSATSVTLAPLQEKSPFEAFVQQYWKHGAALAGAISVAIVILHLRSEASRAERAGSWDAVATRTTVDPFTRALQAEAATWDSLAQELRGREAGPWARLLQAKRLVEDRKFDEARAALAAFKTDYAQHPLLTDALRWSDDDKGESLVACIERRLAERAQWEALQPGLFANPLPEAGDPRVVLKTSKGEVVIALYPSRAPQHVSKFLELVDAKYFDGMAFHAVAAGQSASVGDPNTKAEDLTQWGQGGREIVLPFETSGLHHFEGALSAEQGEGAEESLGGRISLIVADNLLEDDTRVVFGTVESGLDVARQIAAAETDPASPARPKEPIRVLSASRQ